MSASPAYFKPAPSQSETVTADLCVYSGVSGGVIAAIEASRRGLSVVLLEPSSHLGGMTAGGLSCTDIGNKAAIGGLSREFYQRAGQHYGVKEEWRFEPHIAEKIYENWLKETSVRLYKNQFVESLVKENGALTALKTVSGLIVKARMFIDASYEGDLMALAGVSFTVGREANSLYGETHNGAQIRKAHQFDFAVDPYVKPGVPASGLLPGIDTDSSYSPGAGDHRVQAYNFRMCLTQREDIRIPFPKPSHYDESWYILMKRYLATGWNEAFHMFSPIRNGKTDTNNHGAASTDFIGQNHAFPTADYPTREKIFQAHRSYQQGVQWCLANDPEVPAAIRDVMATWGLCRDEFTDCGGWPHQLYVREARRMVADYVMTEHNCTGKVVAEDPVGLAAYGMDSHNCRRLVRDGIVKNEGDVQEHGFSPYTISYRSIVPKKTECTNLFVPFCLSATHIAFGSIRMEPVHMVLSQSAAIAAHMALKEGRAVQDIDYPALQSELLAARQVLKWTPEMNQGPYQPN
jgi:hypothetical protein